MKIRNKQDNKTDWGQEGARRAGGEDRSLREGGVAASQRGRKTKKEDERPIAALGAIKVA